jgi:S1-C subfamily serine protease
VVALYAVAAPRASFADAAAPVPPAADAPIPSTPIGFSKLLLRIEGKDEIGIASAGDHVRLLEHMRAKGFHAVGAENLVFGKDASAQADYLVGGTVRELACEPHRGAPRCRVGIEWQVLDVARDEVVYAALTRAAVLDASAKDLDRIAGRLLDGALDRLLERPAFRRTIAWSSESARARATSFTLAALPRCEAGHKVAEGGVDLLRKVVVVKGKHGFGSGVVVSPEGLVLTAAHVVDGAMLKLRFRDGVEVDATPVRVAEHEDVALLRPTKPLAGAPCAALREEPPVSGAEVYAAGAPASLELAFSLTRGIVSGLPVIDGQRRLQTDASVSPGNSGGPVADADGAVAGIVSFKIVSTKVEGVAFAVPTRETLAALGLRVGDATDPALLTATASLPAHGTDAIFKDVDDPIPSLDPEGDHARRVAKEEKEAEADRDRRTPFASKALYGAGIAGMLFGGTAVTVTWLKYKDYALTEAQAAHLKTWNTVGWATLGAGVGAFALSFALRPPKGAAPTVANVSIHIGLDGAGCEGEF